MGREGMGIEWDFGGLIGILRVDIVFLLMFL